MNSALPAVGSWYQQLDGSLLEVVAVDLEEDTIEVQHFDGTVEEFDAESWEEQRFREADAPEDWTGSVDVEPEDHENERESSPVAMWADPLGFLDRNEAPGYSEWPAPAE
jgi:hypothetical protein